MLREEAAAYLDGVNGKNMKLGLEHIELLMERLNWPDRSLKIIHITGTNGKGSTSEFISSMLQEAGYKVGTFNSPYFESPCECVRINGVSISEEDLLGYMNEMESELTALKEQQQLPSGFEILTALALWHFARRKVDFVVLEVGLGGRLDATNVIGHSMASVFTKITKDHINILGDTLEAIANEKAGIIKKDSLVISADQQPEVIEVLNRKCREAGCRMYQADAEEVSDVIVTSSGTAFNYQGESYQLQMLGKHQAENCILAMKVIEVLRETGRLTITEAQIKSGIYKMKWPGRFEKVKDKPEIYLDGAHNLDGVQSLKATLKALEPAYTIGVVGILRDKEVSKMLEEVKDCFEELIVTAPDHVRALDADSLEKAASTYFPRVIKAQNIDQAVNLAIKKAEEKHTKVRIVCFGSLYMIADIRKIIK